MNPVTKMEKPTKGLNSDAWKKHMNEFTKKTFRSVVHNARHSSYIQNTWRNVTLH